MYHTSYYYFVPIYSFEAYFMTSSTVFTSWASCSPYDIFYVSFLVTSLDLLPFSTLEERSLSLLESSNPNPRVLKPLPLPLERRTGSEIARVSRWTQFFFLIFYLFVLQQEHFADENSAFLLSLTLQLDFSQSSTPTPDFDLMLANNFLFWMHWFGSRPFFVSLDFFSFGAAHSGTPPTACSIFSGLDSETWFSWFYIVLSTHGLGFFITACLWGPTTFRIYDVFFRQIVVPWMGLEL